MDSPFTLVLSTVRCAGRPEKRLRLQRSADVASGHVRDDVLEKLYICGCDALIMLGVDWAKPLVRRSSDEGAVGIGLASALGLGLPTADGDGFLLSGSLGLSFSAVGGKAGGPRIIPYVTPGVGFGTLTGDDGASGIRPMIAGGLGFAAANGFGVSAGFQHVPLEGGQMVVGVAVTIGGR